VTQFEQLVIDRGARAEDRRAHAGEPAARRSLRAQVARLEGELSAIVAEGFPFISAPVPIGGVFAGPHLLSLGEHERRAHELLERMKLEPGRYRFVRLPVTDLGQGGCGVWEVRPRLGLIGMLAGWWQVKLSSGCPLAKGSRSMRGPAGQS
jgi:hypothetical protein